MGLTVPSRGWACFQQAALSLTQSPDNDPQPVVLGASLGIPNPAGHPITWGCFTDRHLPLGSAPDSPLKVLRVILMRQVRGQAFDQL